MDQERACGRTAEVGEYVHRVVEKADQTAGDREQVPSKTGVGSARDKARGRAEAGDADAAS